MRNARAFDRKLLNFRSNSILQRERYFLFGDKQRTGSSFRTVTINDNPILWKRKYPDRRREKLNNFYASIWKFCLVHRTFRVNFRGSWSVIFFHRLPKLQQHYSPLFRSKFYNFSKKILRIFFFSYQSNVTAIMCLELVTIAENV